MKKTEDACMRTYKYMNMQDILDIGLISYIDGQ
jgi:hypothetical protein